MEKENAKRRRNGAVKLYLSREVQAKLQFVTDAVRVRHPEHEDHSRDAAISCLISNEYSRLMAIALGGAASDQVNTDAAGTGTGGSPIGGRDSSSIGDGGAFSPLPPDTLPDNATDGTGGSRTDGGSPSGDSTDAAASGRRRGRK